LSSGLRAALDPFLKEAQAFCDREKQIGTLEAALRRDPSLTRLKTYARLTRRNGRTRAAAAARLVLKAAQQSTSATTTVAGELAADTLLRDVIGLCSTTQTGQVHVQLTNDAAGTIRFAAGQIVDAAMAGARGRAALMLILAAHDGSYRFVPSDTPVDPPRIEDASPWVLVKCLEQLSEERRARHTR
jgi:hypothetical protein